MCAELGTTLPKKRLLKAKMDSQKYERVSGDLYSTVVHMLKACRSALNTLARRAGPTAVAICVQYLQNLQLKTRVSRVFSFQNNKNCCVRSEKKRHKT